MANVIFDTNIYIYHHLHYPVAVDVWRQYVRDHDVLMPTIQVAELLSYPKIDDRPDIRQQREGYISLADEEVYGFQSVGNGTSCPNPRALR